MDDHKILLVGIKFLVKIGNYQILNLILGDTRGVIVIIVGSGISDTSLNSG